MKRWIEAWLLTVSLALPMLFEQVAWADYGLAGRWPSEAASNTLPSSGESSFFRSFVDDLGKGRPPVWLKVPAVPARSGDQLPTPPLPAAATTADGPIGPQPEPGYVRLPGHVLAALQRATPVPPTGSVPLSPEASAAQQAMTLTLVLKRDDQTGFDRYMKAVYDPHSKQFQHFLSQSQISKRFGPAPRSYAALQAYLHDRGLKTVQGSKNRMTLTMGGTRAQVEQALAMHIADYTIGGVDFYANDSDPALPLALASHVSGIEGLSNLAQPRHSFQGAPPTSCSAGGHSSILRPNAIHANEEGNSCSGQNPLLFPIGLVCTAGAIGSFAAGFTNPLWWLLTVFFLLCDLSVIIQFFTPSSSVVTRAGLKPRATTATLGPATGAGQKIGLLEFDSYLSSDVADFLTLLGMPADRISNLSEVRVNGGASRGAGQSEVLLDIDTIMIGAPDAKLTVYDAPFDGKAASYSSLFNAMIDGGMSVISNSWASCEDQVSQADAQAIDTVLQTAAASGISVFNAAGDTGGTCLDGSANTISVPADSPNATAVGGSSVSPGQGFTYGTETWWNGTNAVPATGQGGFGMSRYFSRPAYQSALSSAAMRSVPDVVANADPASGSILCEADAGGCPTGLLYGGTSIAAPEWAVYAALLNQAHGKNIGAFNAALYPLAGSNAFHSAAALGSDVAHVGLGSASLNNLNLAINQRTAGVPDATASLAVTLVAGSSVTSGSVPADGTNAGLLVRLLDASGNKVSGKTVVLSADSANVSIPTTQVTTDGDNGVALFQFSDLTPETVTFTVTDSSDGVTLATKPSITFGVPAASGAGLNVFPTEVTADGSSTASISITLKDSLGRPTPGKTITISQGGGQSVIGGPTPAVTDSNGQITFTATDQTNETVTYGAVDVSDGNLTIPGSGTVTFSNAGASDCTSNPPVGANGYVLTPFATGFAAGDFFYADVNFGGCPGATNPAFDPSGAVYVSDFANGNIYRFTSSGGSATPGNVTTNPALGPSLGTLVYGKDGNVYTTLITGGYFTDGSVVQVDPASGTILRTVASGYTCPTGLSVDPLSGDLFFNDGCYGAGSDNPGLWRITDPGNTDPSNPTAVSLYATLPYTANAEIAIAPNGTLYVASGNPTSYPGGWVIVQVSGTGTAQPATVTTLSGINSDNGSVAIGQTNSDGSAKTLVVHETASGDTTGGALQTVDITTNPPSVVSVLATGDIGIGTIGPDGCNYIGGHHNVYKLAPASGNCGLTPTSPGPALTLSPASVATNPAQGTSQSFTATLKNLSSPAGIPVIFTITGANPQIKLVDADANGQAVLSYTAVKAGTDMVVATATVPSPTTTTGKLQSAPVALDRSPGRSASVPAAVAALKSAHVGSGASAAHDYPAAPLSAETAAARSQGLVRTAAVASADSSDTTSTTLSSNAVQLTWNSGAHVSFVSLNPSPTGGLVGQPVSVVASLSDISASPAVAVSGQSITFNLNGASCSATTNASGLASCALKPAATGSFALTASFVGTASLAASNTSTHFTVTPVPSGTSSTSSGGGGGGGSMAPDALALLAMLEGLRRRRRLDR